MRAFFNIFFLSNPLPLTPITPLFPLPSPLLTYSSMNLLMFITRKVVAPGPSHLRKGSLSKAAESATSVASEAVSVAAVVVVVSTAVGSSVGGVVAGGVVTVVVPVSVSVVTIVVAIVVSVVASSVIIAVVVVIAIAIAIVSVSVVVAVVAIVVTTVAGVRSLRSIRLTSKRNSRRLLRESRSHNCVAQKSIDSRAVLLRVVGTRVLVRLDSIREVGLVLCNLIRDLLQSLRSCDLLRAVGLFLGVDLLDGEATTEGTSKSIITAADGADIAS